MEAKNTENIVEVIERIAHDFNISLQAGDIQAFSKAYLKFGDVDLAVNEDGQVLSDLMEAEDLDIIADALKKKFGKQSQSFPEQTYPVKVNGERYETRVDEYGNQRFKGSRILEDLIAKDSAVFEQAQAAYKNGEYSTDEWVEFNVAAGSKVKSFMLSLQTSVNFENSREENL